MFKSRNVSVVATPILHCASGEDNRARHSTSSLGAQAVIIISNS